MRLIISLPSVLYSITEIPATKHLWEKDYLAFHPFWEGEPKQFYKTAWLLLLTVKSTNNWHGISMTEIMFLRFTQKITSFNVVKPKWYIISKLGACLLSTFRIALQKALKCGQVYDEFRLKAIFLGKIYNFFVFSTRYLRAFNKCVAVQTLAHLFKTLSTLQDRSVLASQVAKLSTVAVQESCGILFWNWPTSVMWIAGTCSSKCWSCGQKLPWHPIIVSKN